MGITIKEYSSAGKILRQKDLRQALYDAGEVLMEKVLVNLHGNEHKSRRSVESKILQPNFFRWYEKEVFSKTCLLYTSPSPRDRQKSRMPSSA